MRLRILTYPTTKNVLNTYTPDRASKLAVLDLKYPHPIQPHTLIGRRILYNTSIYIYMKTC